jgi:hypothetical protein
MRKVLPRTVFTVLLLVHLLPQAVLSAGSPHSVFKKMPRHAGCFALALAAPADVTVSTDPYSDVATSVYLGVPEVSGDGVTVSNNAPSYYPIGATTVTWTATDKSGAKTLATQQVTVKDEEQPYISRLGEISVVNDAGGCNARIDLMIPFAFDNSGQVTVTHDGPGAVFPVGTTMIIWTATDPSGNADTMVQRITVIDNELPAIQILQAGFAVTVDGGQCGASVNLGTPVVSDNCGIASVTNNAPAVFPVGTTVITWTVTDLNQYTVTAQQTVTVTDNELPTITAPSDITTGNDAGKNGAAVPVGSATVNDNCGVASVTNDAPAFFATGTTVVTWTVTDIHGNARTATQSITVKDLEAPVLLSIPANVTVSCESVPAAAAVPAKDNCDAAPVVAMTQASTQGTNTALPSRYNYSLTRTWTATDKSGNQSNAGQVITVVDKTAPVITAPNIVINTEAGKCSAVVKYAVTVADNSASPLTVTYSKSSGSSFATGISTVTVTAKDVSGNSASKSFTVTVNDAQKPVITAPNDVTVTVSNNNSSASNVALGKPVTSDNCGVASVTSNAPNSFPVGTTVVTWTVKDLSGNTTTDVQNVTVNRRKSNSSDLVQGVVISEATMLELVVGPNPSAGHFTLKWKSALTSPVHLQVTDMLGRIVDVKAGLPSSGSIQVGQGYPAGSYIAEMMQGAQRKTVQLIRLK